LKGSKDENGLNVYWLDAPEAANKIHVVQLKELLQKKLKVEFTGQPLLVDGAAGNAPGAQRRPGKRRRQGR
jgi:hypothetical protein